MKQLQQPNLSPSVRPPPPSNPSSKKYLTHFQSINTPVKIPPSFIVSSSGTADKNKYNTALQLYASSVSIIDKIADSPVKQSQINYSQGNNDDIVKTSIIVNANPRVRQRILGINRFFQIGRGQVDSTVQEKKFQEGGLNSYIQSIMNIDVKYAITRTDSAQQIRRSRSKSKSKQSFKNIPIPIQTKNSFSPISIESKQKVQQAQVNTQPIAVIQKPSKLKKMDLLLVQIMREKKRKGLVPDYFRAIEMKLVQLLQYILQDEPGYFGLTLKQKMKDVLKNLEHFKGKTIDGQSKVNMLRIFFEQFRNLKKQRQQESQQIQNRSKSNSKKSVSKAQSKKSGNNNQFSLKNNKKNYDTMSLDANRGQKPGQKKNPSQKSSKQQDQWIGSLDK